MKRFGTRFGGFIIVALLASCTSATAFPFPPKSTDLQPVAAQSVSLTPVSLGLGLNETASLVAAVSPADTTDKKVIWSSDDETVATVTVSGLVQGVKVGSAHIVATDSAGHTFSAPVYVDDPKVALTGLTIDTTELKLFTGNTNDLTASVTPADATDPTVTWTSDKPSVAKVSSAGKVTAVAVGTANLTAKNAAGHQKSRKVTVTIAAQSVTVAPVSLGLAVGDTASLIATVNPVNATDKTVTWSTGNATVASVTSAGVVTAGVIGSTVITATDSAGHTAAVPVTVAAAKVAATSISVSPTTLSLLNGASGNLSATVLPSTTTDKTVTWSSGTPSVATVSPSGTVTGASVGTAVITATDSAGHKATATVTINPVAAASVSLDASALTVYVGKTGLLTATVLPANAANKTVTWSIPNTTYATVSNLGVVTGVKATTSAVTVTATDSAGHKATAAITVKNVAPTSVTLSPATVSLVAGTTTTLTPTILPTDATVKTVTWTTSDASIATVTAGVVKGVAPGSVTITATATDATSVKGTAAVTVLPVAATGISLSRSNLSVTVGGTGLLTATVVPTNASNKTVTWTSSNTGIATVSGGTVTGVAVGSTTVTATDSAGHQAQATITVAVATNRMKVGVNFWNPSWQSDNTYYRTGITTAQWATATYNTSTQYIDISGYSDANGPYRPELLADMAVVNGPIRFMDAVEVNSSGIIHWSDRYPATLPQYGSQMWAAPGMAAHTLTPSTTEPAGLPLASSANLHTYWYRADSNPNALTATGAMSYEWMIDLCNRTNRDMWVNIPAFADADHVTRLATLIRDRLKSNLKVWVEYSNEYWNYISVAYQYSLEPTVNASYPGENQWYKGVAWCVSQAIKDWKIFSDVFGSANLGYNGRCIRVLAGSGNSDESLKAIRDVIYNGTIGGALNPVYNPSGMVPDVIACAPYIGPYDNTVGDGWTVKLDGADANIAAKYRANIDYNMVHYVPPWKAMAVQLSVPLVTYEGGNQLDTNPAVWNSNQAIAVEYAYFMDQLDKIGVSMFCAYTWTGAYGTNSAWGLRSLTGDSDAASPKWRAVAGWISGQPWDQIQ